MQTQTNTTSTSGTKRSGKVEVKRLMPTEQQLTTADLPKLKRRAIIKAELRKLDDELKPKISAMIDARGVGQYVIGKTVVELKRQERQSVAWKPLAYSLLEESAILEVQEAFTVPYNIDRAVIK